MSKRAEKAAGQGALWDEEPAVPPQPVSKEQPAQGKSPKALVNNTPPKVDTEVEGLAHQNGSRWLVALIGNQNGILFCRPAKYPGRLGAGDDLAEEAETRGFELVTITYVADWRNEVLTKDIPPPPPDPNEPKPGPPIYPPDEPWSDARWRELYYRSKNPEAVPDDDPFTDD